MHLRSEVEGLSFDSIFTFAVQPLPDNPPQQRAAVVTEGGRLVVVDVELVRNVDAKALSYGLKETTCDDVNKPMLNGVSEDVIFID